MMIGHAAEDGAVEPNRVNSRRKPRFVPKRAANPKSRLPALAGLIERHNTPDCVGVCIEEPFSGHFTSVKALLPMLDAAVLTCEWLGLPWSIVNLAHLKKHATGKGNAKKGRDAGGGEGEMGS